MRQPPHPSRVRAALAIRTKVRPVRLIGEFATVLVAAALVAGCGSVSPKPLPKVTGQSLDAAEANLDAVDLHYSVVGGGVFGVVARSRWQVCRQLPAAGVVAAKVTLFVARTCDAPPAAREAVVPDLSYESLDVAEAQLAKAGLGWTVEADGAVVDRSDWEVCEQTPGPGEWGRSVELYVDRSCDDWGW
jgi:beta-lactam-binding protein with PASTA domain